MFSLCYAAVLFASGVQRTLVREVHANQSSVSNFHLSGQRQLNSLMSFMNDLFKFSSNSITSNSIKALLRDQPRSAAPGCALMLWQEINHRVFAVFAVCYLHSDHFKSNSHPWDS